MDAKKVEPNYGNVGRYIGRPYEKANCLDIAREFYMREFQIEIRQYYEGPVPSRKDVEALIVSNKGEFVPVEGEPHFGDLVVIKLYGVECHLGIFIQKGKFLHSIKTAGSVLDSLVKYEKMIVGFYRHRGLAA